MLVLQLIHFVDWLFNLYSWVIVGNVIMSWLVVFSVVNMHNPVVRTVGNTLYRLTEPVLGRIRRFLPAMGGVDLSPLVALIAIVFIRHVLLINLKLAVAARAGF